MSLDLAYWEKRHSARDTPWQLPVASPPLVNFMESMSDKKLSILIPGAGTGLEALALAKMGFEQITVLDISPTSISRVKASIPHKWYDNMKFVAQDFFDHSGKYDIILEQTFFCALEPRFRESYIKKCHQLIDPDGMLVGVLFSRKFEGGPPYGGDSEEYERLFTPHFHIKTMERCHNSYSARLGNELFIQLKPKSNAYRDSQP